jgi:glyoxylase-like metal-dependent hydrolase (beta-lactamase superfamily II)
MYFHPIGTQKITDNTYTVNTTMVNFYVYTDGKDTICFDSGINGMLAKIGMGKLNIDPASVSKLFLTHSDYDHAGGLKLFKNADIYLSAGEEQMINHTTPRMLFKYNSKIKRGYTLLEDNDVVKVGGIKVRAIATPGHTPGSMSYIVNDSVLFAGDTLLVRRGEVIPFNSFQNMDTRTQKESIKKLMEIKIVLS